MTNGDHYSPDDTFYPRPEIIPRPVSDEISIKISAKGKGVAALERTFGALPFSTSGRQMPHESIYYVDGLDPEQYAHNPAYQSYLKDAQLAIEERTQEVTPTDDPLTIPYTEPMNPNEDDEPLSRFDHNESTSSKHERRALKRIRNLALIAVLATGGFTVASHAGDAGANAQKICSPQGTSGIFDVLGNSGCYTHELVSYSTNLSNYIPGK